MTTYQVLAPGDRVRKESNHPFKSTRQVNTLLKETVNPHTGRIAWTFEEDDSIVDAHILVKDVS